MNIYFHLFFDFIKRRFNLSFC